MLGPGEEWEPASAQLVPDRTPDIRTLRPGQPGTTQVAASATTVNISTADIRLKNLKPSQMTFEGY